MSDEHHPVPDHFFYNIGVIAAKWSAVEAEIEFTLLECFDMKIESGLILTSRLATRSKVDLLRVVLNFEADNGEPRDDAAFVLLNKLEAAYVERNKAVHSVWAGTSDPHVASRSSIQAKGKLKYSDTPVRIQELEEHADNLSRLGEELHSFRLLMAAKNGRQDTA